MWPYLYLSPVAIIEKGQQMYFPSSHWFNLLPKKYIQIRYVSSNGNMDVYLYPLEHLELNNNKYV